MIEDSAVDDIAENLGAASLGLYSWLERRADRAGDVRAGYDRIAEVFQWSRSTAIRQIATLEGRGYVRISKTRARDGRQGPNVFHLPHHRQSVTDETLDDTLDDTLEPDRPAPKTPRKPRTSRPQSSTRDTLAGSQGVDQGVIQSSTSDTPRVDTSSYSNGKPSVSDDRGVVYALVDRYAKAKGLEPKAIQGRQRSEGYSAFKHLPAQGITGDDVAGCVAWLLTDTFYQQPGKITVGTVARTIPEWVAAGRPARYNRSGGGRADRVAPQTIVERAAARLAQRNQEV